MASWPQILQGQVALLQRYQDKFSYDCSALFYNQFNVSNNLSRQRICFFLVLRFSINTNDRLRVGLTKVNPLLFLFKINLYTINGVYLLIPVFCLYGFQYPINIYLRSKFNFVLRNKVSWICFS